MNALANKDSRAKTLKAWKYGNHIVLTRNQPFLAKQSQMSIASRFSTNNNPYTTLIVDETISQY